MTRTSSGLRSMISTAHSTLRCIGISWSHEAQQGWRRLGLASVPQQRSVPIIQARELHHTIPSAKNVPLQKLLKDERKRKRAAKRELESSSGKHGASAAVEEEARRTARLGEWDLTVGIEVHAQLNTDKKLFSSSRTSTEDEPNSNVSIFDLAFPGSQPVFQKETLVPALRAAIALNCTVQRESRFDRKHYFYPDQPAGYQITQYYMPFATNGQLTLSEIDGLNAKDGDVIIGLQKIQMEQDTAKSIVQHPSTAMLDFNRVGHPLIEIITHPHIHSPHVAAACVRKISSILHTVNAVTTGIELGGLRADVNVSVSRKGSTTLGQRVEIKNMSSFQAIEDAVIAERDRQLHVLESGGSIRGETRGWTLGSTETTKLRSKEGEVDYRYMPDPDIAPLLIGQSLIDHITNTLPPLQDSVVNDLMSASRLTMKDAKTLVMLDGGQRLDYFDDVKASWETLRSGDGSVKQHSAKPQGRDSIVANWVLHELGGLLNKAMVQFSARLVEPRDMALIIHNLEEGRITRPSAKQILSRIFVDDIRDVEEAIREDQLSSHMAPEEYKAMAEQLIAENADKVRDIQQRKQLGKLQWFMGQMIRQGKGSVQPEKAEMVLKELLGVGK